MSDTLSRRDFLFYGGATALGITLGELGRRQLARGDARAAAWRDRGLETWATSVCRECPAACGVRVRLMDGVPVKLEGNPLCPIARGRLCAKGQAGIEAYFDPDRLIGPARRVGKRGEGRWEPITWAAAMDLLASHVRQAQGHPGGSIVALAAEEQGPLADAWARFWRAGGAQVAWTPGATAARLEPGLRAITGAKAHPLFDVEHATHVLSFGASIVEDWLSPVWSQRSFGRFRRGPSRQRGRLVQVDVRRSLTARKADEWLALPDGQQVALAYGLAAVLLRENRVHRAFLDEFGGNLAAFEREVVARYSPDSVAALTGIPVVTVLRLARELAASSQPLVVVAAEANPKLVEAVFALNALVGAFDRPGGIVACPATPVPEAESAVTALHDIAAGSLRPRLLALRDASALRSLSAPLDPSAGLESATLVVSFSPFLDETASIADLLLPTHTALEAWHLLAPAPAAPAEAIAVTKPAVQPRLDTRDAAAILKAAADTVGGALAEACPWKSSEDLVGAELDRRWSLRRGGPYADTYETEWVRQMERGGWWAAPAAARDDFASAVVQAGGWADPFLIPGQIREALRARGGLSFPLPPSLPTSLPGSVSKKTRGAAEYPLTLVPFTPAVVNLAGSPNQPVLFELLGQPESVPWRVWAELGPETARELSIERGARVRIASSHGSVEAVAVLVDGMPPQTVALAYVPAVPTGGRWARWMGADARLLWGNGKFVEGCAVRVTRA